MNKHVAYVKSAYVRKNFSAFLIDLWGTVHDGCHALDNALSFLKSVFQDGKLVILVSNSPSHPKLLQWYLKNTIGLHKDVHYHQIITAGAVAFNLIEKHFKGKNCLTWGDDQEGGDWLIHKGDLHVVESMKDNPDLILQHRVNYSVPWTIDRIETEYDSTLNDALKMGIPMVCANPDRYYVHGKKRYLVGAGEISYRYERKGGKVFWCGKPEGRIYDLFKEEAAKLGFRGKNRDIACIGDNLETDIPGGARAGMSTFFFTGGVHAQELKSSDMSFDKLFAKYQCPEPDGVLEHW